MFIAIQRAIEFQGQDSKSFVSRAPQHDEEIAANMLRCKGRLGVKQAVVMAEKWNIVNC